MTVLDIVGYIGSVLVAVSLTMSNIKRLRWYNLVGAAVFSVYGYLINSIPVFLLNGWIVLVDIYYLYRLYQFKDEFDMVRLISVKTPLFELLMKHYKDDLLTIFPNASLEEMEAAVPMLILRNLKPVGLFVYRRCDDEPPSIEVLVDYVIPEERDFKTAQFLFNRHASELRSLNINTVISRSKRAQHKAYLAKVGFEPRGEDMVLDLR